MIAVIQYFLKLFGFSGSAMIEKLVQSVLLGGKSSTTGGKNPLEDLMAQFKDNGLGSIVNSWVGTGKDEAITPQQVAQGIGLDKMNAMAAQAGMTQEKLAEKLAKYLPGMVDKMTPGGKLP